MVTKTMWKGRGSLQQVQHELSNDIPFRDSAREASMLSGRKKVPMPRQDPLLQPNIKCKISSRI